MTDSEMTRRNRSQKEFDKKWTFDKISLQFNSEFFRFIWCQ